MMLSASNGAGNLPSNPAEINVPVQFSLTNVPFTPTAALWARLTNAVFWVRADGLVSRPSGSSGSRNAAPCFAYGVRFNSGATDAVRIRLNVIGLPNVSLNTLTLYAWVPTVTSTSLTSDPAPST